MTRLEILRASLAKKELDLDQKISLHFASVKAANGQPLNDKRNGAATLTQWERQNNAIRAAKAGVEVTKAAIAKEESKIAHVASVELPAFIKDALAAGELVQWRRYPNRFFVPGVERGRIIWDESKQAVLASYVRDIPQEQYPKFRDTFNKMRAFQRKMEEI